MRSPGKDQQAPEGLPSDPKFRAAGSASGQRSAAAQKEHPAGNTQNAAVKDEELVSTLSLLVKVPGTYVPSDYVMTQLQSEDPIPVSLVLEPGHQSRT